MSGAPVTQDRSPWGTHVAQVVARLKLALADVVRSVPDMQIDRPNDLSRELQIDPKLAWKIAKVIDCADPFAAAQYAPGSGGLRTFLRAAGRRHAPRAVLDAARQAFTEFEGLINFHAGSRRVFDQMLAAHTNEDEQPRLALEQRKLAFQGNSYTWGVQARLVLRTHILHVAADPRMWDDVSIRGFVDLRWIRPNVAWRISRPHSVDDTHQVHDQFEREPLDPRSAAGHDPLALPLLTEFCSQPLPHCRQSTGAASGLEYELVETSVGNTGVLTCLTGEILRAAEPRYRTEKYADFAVSFPIRTPAEMLVFDLIVHRDVFGERVPRIQLFSDLFDGSPTFQYGASDRLPVLEPLECLAPDLELLRLREFPRYADLLRFALERLGWTREEFRVFRMRLPFPPIPTTLMLTHPLPEAPGPSR